MNDLLEYSQRVRDILSDPKVWTTGCLFRTPEGRPIRNDVLSEWEPAQVPDDCLMCLNGAKIKALNHPGWTRDLFQQHTVAFCIANNLENDANSPVRFNDAISTTHGRLLDALDRTVELVRGNLPG